MPKSINFTENEVREAPQACWLEPHEIKYVFWVLKSLGINKIVAIHHAEQTTITVTCCNVQRINYVFFTVTVTAFNSQELEM